DQVQSLRDKARRSDMVADEYALYDFFDAHIPAEVTSGKAFEQWRRDAEVRDPKVLFLSRDDILLDDAGELTPERYPSALGPQLPLAYRFDPGADDDGITVSVPIAMLPQLDPAVLMWTIPGWHEAKLRALLDSLPKAQRKALGFLDELASGLAGDLKPFDGAMLPAVERAVFARTGERVTREAWDLHELPAYLSFAYRVVDEHDKTLAEGRDLVELQQRFARRAVELWERAPRAQHERKNLKTWDFDALPASVAIDVGGRKLLAYPALVDAESGVDVKLLDSPAAAAASSRDGLRRLFLLNSGTTIVKLEATLPPTLASQKRTLVLRSLDEAFETTAMPASRGDFAERLAAGRVRLPAVLGDLVRVALDLVTELERARALLKPLASRPGVTRAGVEDIQAQLAELVPADLMRATPTQRLVHITRYLKAVIVRLQRLSHDPLKDQQKATQVAPFVRRYQQLPATAESDRDELRWLVEELRVQVFAPELKTAVPISPQRLQDAFARLGR
ncbi:MAG TPA: DUF3418 domain-containing protein, partial [Kofleriaceae bacterium]